MNPPSQHADRAPFSAGWLQQREPFDAVARETAAARMSLPARLAGLRPTAGTPWRIIDLACGTGANLRWLAPRLGGAQQWQVLDHDKALLKCWPARLAAAHPGHLAPGFMQRGVPLHRRLRFRGPGFDATIVRQQTDLAQALEALPWHAAHLVTASALLDLVSAAWLRRLVAASVSAGVALHFALSVDGRHHWAPHDWHDAVVGALFAAHQQRDKGFGPALGARAVPLLRRLLRSAGYRVHTARSDWRLDGRSGPRALALQRALVDGMASAACEQAPDATAMVQGWRQRRHVLAAQGSVRVGHLDVLALPPG
jgi:SAM-dependent methyltransferase